ncbi:MAG TPA: hypothetical protein P5572_07190, partial [Phycisphaerae bacterium]|nr:hypothetical protein [Phycisphaerae bacterium]
MKTHAIRKLTGKRLRWGPDLRETAFVCGTWTAEVKHWLYSIVENSIADERWSSAQKTMAQRLQTNRACSKKCRNTSRALTHGWVLLACSLAAHGQVTATPPATPGREQVAQYELTSTLQHMQEVDTALQRDFSASFTITIPHSAIGPDRGRHTKTCRLTRSGALSGMTIQWDYSQEPVFWDVGTHGCARGDYDRQGNLILWRPMRKWCYSAPDLNRVIDEQTMLLISPDGEIVHRGEQRVVHEYDPGDPDTLFEIGQFMRALGRGFGHRFADDRTGRQVEEGLLQLTAASRTGIDFPGKWHVVLDTRSNYLVRSA